MTFLCIAYEVDISDGTLIRRRWGRARTKQGAFQFCWSAVRDMLQQRYWMQPESIIYEMVEEA